MQHVNPEEILSYLSEVSPQTHEVLFPIRPIGSDNKLVVEIDEARKYFLLDPHTESTLGHASLHAQDFIKGFPSQKRTVAGVYTNKVEATDISVLRFFAGWGPENVIFTPDAEQYAEWLLLRIDVSSQNTARIAAFNQSGTIPRPPKSYRERDNLPLMNHQRTATITAHLSPFYALLFEQGTGKTPVVISRVSNEARERGPDDPPYKVLVVCPKNIRTNWFNEFCRFSTEKGKVGVIQGTQLDRFQLLLSLMKKDNGNKFSTAIMGYDTVVRDFARLFMWNWDLIVLDEAQAIKSTYTKRFKEFMKLRDRAKQRMVLTGTPVTNSPLDLYALLEFLDDGLSGFKSFDSFRKYYARFDNREQTNMITGYKNLPIMKERLAAFSFVVKKKDVLKDLPEKTYEVREVGMTTKQKKIYEVLKRQIVLEAERDLAEAKNKAMAVEHVFTKLLRLAQVTCGILRWDAQEDEFGATIVEAEVEMLPCPKMDELLLDLKALPLNEKAVVWSCFVPALKEVHKNITAMGMDAVMFYGSTSEKDREIALTRFNSDPTCRVLVANQSAGAAGLNLVGYNYWDTPDKHLDTNTTLMAWYAQDWSMVKRNQGEDRNHRHGTRVPVVNRDYVVPGTIDAEIRDRVTGMIEMADDLTNMQGLSERVLKATSFGDDR